MVLKQSVIDAFRVIGVSPDTPEERAVRVYKRLALEHHPDRNLDKVAAATARFQEIGAAWEICTRHYRNPQSSGDFATGYDEDNFNDDLSDDDMFDYYEYMLYEMFMNAEFRFSRKGFRSQRQSGYGPSFTSFYSHPFQKSFSYSGVRSSDYETLNEKRQRKEKEKYEQRIREFEAECAQKEREEVEAERGKMIQAKERAAIQAEVFALARSGDSTGVRNIVLKHSLDVTGPEKVPKQQKKDPPTNYNTLLHVAASKCDVELVMFLLDKGANLSSLNKDNLAPFHSAILFGNTPVVQYFLSRRGKSLEGCHPSRAVADGRTPLQMAIASGSAPTVELLLKDATVHDVERCWESLSLPVAMKDILETKKGFVPYLLESDGAPLSRKAALKAEAARKRATEKEEKARRIAVERARAAENARKKEERAAKRAEAERAKEIARFQLEEEENRTAEGARVEEEQAKLKAEEEEHSAGEREAECRQVEEEERQRAQFEACQEEARRKAANDAQRAAQMKARQKLEEERQKGIKQEAERKRRAEAELESHGKEAEVPQTEARQMEVGVHQRETEAVQNTTTQGRHDGPSVSMSERGTQVGHGKYRQTKSQSRKAAVVSPRLGVDVEAKRAETLRRLQAQAEEHERLKLQRQQATLQLVAPPIVSSDKAATGTDAKMEAIMRKRAQQSARDKARHQRMKEGKALRENANRTGVDPSPPADQEPQEDKKVNTRSRRQSTYPLTPISTSSSPVSWIKEPCYPVATPITLPMTPENLQTCAIPEDLFAYVPPKSTHPVSSPSSWPLRGRLLPEKQGRHGDRGREWRGRGRGRSGYVAQHESSQLGALFTRRDAEQELAEKNLGRWKNGD
ncbi:hypothetical protein H2248_009713 [Termitomyces sp. 'cryptogamus']|nr:hypothetical protein H2248_009713 [Termitomyces sp. 'cryptogamus']